MVYIDKASDRASFEAIPLQDRHWPTTTYAALTQCAQRFADLPALCSLVSTSAFERMDKLSFNQLIGRVRQMANALSSLGNGRTDVTAYFLPNMVDTQIVLWGAQAVGIAFPLNTLLSPNHVVALLRESGARILVTSPADARLGWHGWEQLRPFLPECSGLDHVLLAGDAVASSPLPDERFQVSSLHERLSEQPADRLAFDDEPRETDVSSFFCTGGTTGLPKLAVRTHRNEALNPQMFAAMLGGSLTVGSRFLIGLPLFHVNAAVTSFTTWISGGEVILAGPGYRDAGIMEHFWEIVEALQVNFFAAVPTILSDLLARPVHGDISCLRFAICGAASLSVELFQRFERASGLKILEGYGLTETTCVASVNPYGGDRKVGSVGIPVPYSEIRCLILDAEGNYVRECETGESGVVVVAGPHVFQGYTDPSFEEGLWFDLRDGKRWLNTGDLGRMDEDGYLWLAGRRKDLIIRGGHNIDPAMIEEALYRHDDVALAAAVGRPDPRVGELPVAYVTLRPGATVSADELEAFSRDTISDRAAIPRAVIVLDEMPKTAVGKVSKAALVEREIRSILDSAIGPEHPAVEVIKIEHRSTGWNIELNVGEEPRRLLHALSGYGFTIHCT